MKTLIAAASADDLAKVRLLLADGIDVNSTDTSGDTALHVAVSESSPEVAALLLAHGADYQHRNLNGVAALDEGHVSPERLHEIRQYYQRMPVGPQVESRPVLADLERSVEDLNRDGITRLPGFVDSATLALLKADFQSFIEAVDEARSVGEGTYVHYDEEGGYREKYRYYATNNAFKYSDSLVDLVASDELTRISRSYLGKPVHVRRAAAMRYEPLRRSWPRRSRQELQFGWHHDMEDKMLKVMVLLGDVGAGDQRLRYAPGTHLLRHPYDRFFRNDLEPENCKAELGVDSLDIIDATGCSGDVYIFDTNGMHAAARSGRTPRDSFYVGITGNPHNTWGADISESAKSLVTAKDWSGLGSNPFTNIVTARKRWTIPENLARQRPTWVMNLYRPETWVA